MVDHQKEIARAADARRVLEDPYFQAAWQALFDRAETVLLRGAFDEDGRELVRARRELDWLQQLRRQFERHIETGKLAERQINVDK